jgi:archaeal flagellar protein FlaJ
MDYNKEKINAEKEKNERKIHSREIAIDKEKQRKNRTAIRAIILTDLIRKNRKNIIIGIILGVIISSAVLIFYKNPILSVILFFVVFGLILLSDYLKIKLRESSKIKKIELIFPDFLQLMASNLRAGMTIDRALLMSSRPEFFPLDREIINVGKDIATGKPLENSLNDMAKRIKSESIEKTVFLIISGIKAGGNLSILLEETSKNMRKRGFVEKRAASNVLMYVIFIFVAACIGAPALFSLSGLMVDTLTNTINSMQSAGSMQQSSLPFSFSAVSISINFIIYFSVSFIIVTDILASLILGLVGKGEEREGVKYILPMIAVSLIIFFGLRYLLSGFVFKLMG